MGPMSNPMLPPRPGSSGPQMPNMMLYQSAGGDSRPPSNDLYRSYEQFAGIVDRRMYASPMQRVNAAQKFVQSFGGFGPHGQAKGIGVGSIMSGILLWPECTREDRRSVMALCGWGTSYLLSDRHRFRERHWNSCGPS
jgi:hypothetical protein